MATFVAFDVPLASDGRLQVRVLAGGSLLEVANQPDVDPPGGGIRVRLLGGTAVSVPVLLSIATPDPVVDPTSVPAALLGPQYPAAATAGTAVPAASVFLGARQLTPSPGVAATAVPSATVAFVGTLTLTPGATATRSQVPDANLGLDVLVLYPDPVATSTAGPVHVLSQAGHALHIPAGPDGYAYVRLLDDSTPDVTNLPDLPAPAGELLVRDLAGTAFGVPFQFDTAYPDPASAATRVPHVVLLFGVTELVLTPFETSCGARAFVASLDLGELVLLPDAVRDQSRAFVAGVSVGGSAQVILAEPATAGTHVPHTLMLAAGEVVLTPGATAAGTAAPDASLDLGLLVLFPSAVADRASVPQAAALAGNVFLTPDATAVGALVFSAATLFERFLTPSPVVTGTANPATVGIQKAKLRGLPDAVAARCVVPDVVLVTSGPVTEHPNPALAASAVPAAHCYRWSTNGPVITTKTRAPGHVGLGG